MTSCACSLPRREKADHGPMQMRILTLILFLVMQTAVAGVISDSYTGAPIAVPGLWNAADFDKGGEGIAYHDNVAGNASGQYRTAEDVDIRVGDAGFVVNNFETGEWLQYTINVQTTGTYMLSVRAAHEDWSPQPKFHVEIDGVDVTGSTAIPSTGGWDTFAWIERPNVFILAGTHHLRLVSDQQYFDLSQLRLQLTAAGMMDCSLQPFYACVPRK